MKEWEGPIEDLVRFSCNKISEVYVIKLNGQTYEILEKTFHHSRAKAVNVLNRHLYHQYLQGHYWHEGKDNTFAKEKGMMRIGGGLDTTFKKMAKDTAMWLLDKGIFTIEKINL